MPAANTSAASAPLQKYFRMVYPCSEARNVRLPPLGRNVRFSDAGLETLGMGASEPSPAQRDCNQDRSKLPGQIVPRKRRGKKVEAALFSGARGQNSAKIY